MGNFLKSQLLQLDPVYLAGEAQRLLQIAQSEGGFNLSTQGFQLPIVYIRPFHNPQSFLFADPLTDLYQVPHRDYHTVFESFLQQRKDTSFVEGCRVGVHFGLSPPTLTDRIKKRLPAGGSLFAI